MSFERRDLSSIPLGRPRIPQRALSAKLIRDPKSERIITVQAARS